MAENDLGTILYFQYIGKMETLGNILVPEIKHINKKLYECILCEYNTSRKSQYIRHCDTSKHKGRKQAIILVPKSSEYICKCNKHFVTNSGLWKHKKKCDYKEQKTLALKMYGAL